jgi:hypothetical protein
MTTEDAASIRWRGSTGGVPVTFGLPADYTVRMLPGIPYAGTPYMDISPIQGKRLIRAEFVVRVESQAGTSWIGNFERTTDGLEGVAHTADVNMLLVLAAGQGYFVPALDPEGYMVVTVGGVREVAYVASRRSFVFASTDSLACYSGAGEYLWAGRVVVDRLVVKKILQGTLEGSGSDSEKIVDFRVDLDSGECTYLTDLSGRPLWPYPPGRRYEVD